MKSLALLFIPFCLLLSGCVGFSSKRPDVGLAPKTRSVISDFAGVYRDLSEVTEGKQRSLSSTIGLYYQKPSPDSVAIAISSEGGLSAEATLDSIVLSRGPLKGDGKYVLSKGKMPLITGRSNAEGFFSSGKEKFHSFLYITKGGDLALESSTTYTGTFLIFPAYGQRTAVYVWKRIDKEK